MSIVGAMPESLQPEREQLHRVLGSDVLRNSDSLRHLLVYLGEKSLLTPAEDVKEYTIGIEACGKPPSYDPQKDASVRVQVGRLRQKLQEYYQKDGLEDSILLDLPKGRFTVLFRARPAASVEVNPIRERLSAAVASVRSASRLTLLLVALLVLALTWAGILSRRLHEFDSQAEAIREYSSLWGPFLSRSVPTTAVFGSPSFFASGQYNLFARLYRLTNPDDPRSSPEFGIVDRKIGPLIGPRFDYASMGDAIAVQRLTAFFGSAGIQLHALPAHLAVWESVKDGNLIFIGAWRMHPMLRRLPVTQDFELGADDQIHNRNPQPGEQAIYTTPSHRDTMTYAVVGMFPGLKAGNEVVVVTAHSSPGAAGAADFITSPGSVKIIAERVGLRPGGPRTHFQVLLRVYVDNDVPVKTEYVTHHLNHR
ncbi:MAG: hypothetical protein NT090_25785 [Acidobacteria bacterium]|nr:hypothetical protein [Acidobacteriota bacterium]